MKQRNPFVITGYEGPAYFCDRERETAKIIEAIENGRNLTLIAPRRYGKTGLIHHVFQKLPKEYRPIYLDIFATKNMTEFTRQLALSVVGVLDSSVDRAVAAVAKFFKSCRPTLVPQEDGLPKFSFDIVASEAKNTLGEVFAYLKEHKQGVVIAIDEFQQILEYPECGIEALLRGYIQEIPWVRFIFAGSRHHLMGEMFLSAKHPFYQSTDILSLDVIDREVYSKFAEARFADAGQTFVLTAFEALYDRFEGITWYVQSVLNRLWLRGNGLEGTEQVDAIVKELVADRSLLFRDLYFSQNGSAQEVLMAIAQAGEAKNVYSGDFIGRYALRSASTVRSVLKVLVANDIVYRTENGYVVYDRLFAEWLRMITSTRPFSH